MHQFEGLQFFLRTSTVLPVLSLPHTFLQTTSFHFVGCSPALQRDEFFFHLSLRYYFSNLFRYVIHVALTRPEMSEFLG